MTFRELHQQDPKVKETKATYDKAAFAPDKDTSERRRQRAEAMTAVSEASARCMSMLVAYELAINECEAKHVKAIIKEHGEAPTFTVVTKLRRFFER